MAALAVATAAHAPSGARPGTRGRNGDAILSDDQRRRETVLLPLDQWRLYYYRDNAWSYPQSSGSDNGTGTPNPPSGGTNSSAQLPAIPDGIRVELTLPPDSAVPGRVTMDWVNPLRSNSRS